MTRGVPSVPCKTSPDRGPFINIKYISEPTCITCPSIIVMVLQTKYINKITRDVVPSNINRENSVAHMQSRWDAMGSQSNWVGYAWVSNLSLSHTFTLAFILIIIAAWTVHFLSSSFASDPILCCHILTTFKNEGKGIDINEGLMGYTIINYEWMCVASSQTDSSSPHAKSSNLAFLLLFCCVGLWLSVASIKGQATLL